MCQARAGGIPCHLVTLHEAKNEQEFYAHLKKIVQYVQNFCNPEWTRKSNILLSRLHNSIFCPNDNGYGGNDYGSHGSHNGNDKDQYKPPSYSSYKCGENAVLVDESKYTGGKVCKCKKGYTERLKNTSIDITVQNPKVLVLLLL